MVQSILSSVHLSLFCPVYGENKIEKMMSNFLWESSGDGRKLIFGLLGNVVALSKNKWRLEVGNIVAKKIALLGKRLWRFPTKHNSLWHYVIKSKFEIQDNIWDSFEVFRRNS